MCVITAMTTIKVEVSSSKKKYNRNMTVRIWNQFKFGKWCGEESEKKPCVLCYEVLFKRMHETHKSQTTFKNEALLREK